MHLQQRGCIAPPASVSVDDVGPAVEPEPTEEVNKVEGQSSKSEMPDCQPQPAEKVGARSCGGCEGCGEQRRSFLKGVALASVGILTCRVTSAFASLPPTESWMPQVGDRLVADGAKGPAKALTIDDVPEDTDPLVAYPFDPKTGKVRSERRFAGVILLKFKNADLDQQMAKLAAGGVLAYSQVCVHAGCPISTYMPKKKVFFCFCHYSEYYPLKDGEVASGPAPRPLPNLPLKLASDGKTLIVAGRFNAPIGP